MARTKVKPIKRKSIEEAYVQVAPNKTTKNNPNSLVSGAADSATASIGNQGNIVGKKGNAESSKRPNLGKT